MNYEFKEEIAKGYTYSCILFISESGEVSIKQIHDDTGFTDFIYISKNNMRELFNKLQEYYKNKE